MLGSSRHQPPPGETAPPESQDEYTAGENTGGGANRPTWMNSPDRFIAEWNEEGGGLPTQLIRMIPEIASNPLSKVKIRATSCRLITAA